MDEYYVNQAGSGLGGFAGQRYQKGDGFFGRMISGTVLPMLKKVLPYLGKNLVSTAGDVMTDISQGQKLKDSVKSRLKETGSRIGTDAMAKVKQFTGSGKRSLASKRRRAIRKKPARKQATKRKKCSRKKSSKRAKRASDFL